MQAVRIHQHGDPSVLRVEDIPKPTPGAGQALVRVLGVSLNHLDLWVRRGMPGFPVPFPRILGCDGTGEVVALGSGVSGLKVGDKVVLEPGYSSGNSPEDRAGNDNLAPDYSIRGEHGDGFDCEFVALEARFLLPLPKGIDPVQAAAVPLVFVTAWGLVVSRGQVRPGETVLVLGGASGVGSAAIQIAKQRGARVFATAGSEEKQRLCRELGAEAVLDHRSETWGKEFKKLTAGKGADVVVEHVGPATWKTSMAVLARNGRLVTCGGTTGAMVEIALPHLFIKNQSVLGSTMGPRAAFPEIFANVAKGVFRPVVDRVLPLSQAREAHELLEGRKVVGKIVLVPGKVSVESGMKDAQSIQRAAVLGSGTMGHGIAQVLALAGIATRVYDVQASALDSARTKVKANLDQGVEKGKVAASARDAALAALAYTTDLAQATAGAEVVIEAAPEKLELKRELFAQLGRLPADVLLATNTSSLSITKIAAAAAHPERVVGMHFFNPVHIMKLVEVVRAEKSARPAVELALALALRLGKDPIEVADAPGFASSRLGIAIGLEAIRMVEAGVASPADIDKAMTLGYGFPMGPLRLTDLVGLDVRLSIAEYLAKELGERFTPPALLREKVARGELGKKSGRGFYDWA